MLERKERKQQKKKLMCVNYATLRKPKTGTINNVYVAEGEEKWEGGILVS
jgi:hypothetical protein